MIPLHLAQSEYEETIGHSPLVQPHRILDEE
jgi:hypothetical protein